MPCSETFTLATPNCEMKILSSVYRKWTFFSSVLLSMPFLMLATVLLPTFIWRLSLLSIFYHQLHHHLFRKLFQLSMPSTTDPWNVNNLKLLYHSPNALDSNGIFFSIFHNRLWIPWDGHVESVLVSLENSSTININIWHTSNLLSDIGKALWAIQGKETGWQKVNWRRKGLLRVQF